MNSARKAILALIVANIIWGAAAPIFKLSLQNIPLFTLAFWRFFLGSAVLLTIFGPRLFKTKTLFTLHWKEVMYYTLSGITINILFFFWGLTLTKSINAPVIAASAPIVTAILAWIFLHERTRVKKIIGMVLGCLGILVIVAEPLLTEGIDGALLGNICLIISTLAAVWQTVIGRKILPRFDPMLFTFWSCVIGAFTFLPLATYELGYNPQLYGMLDWRGYLGLIYGSLFSTATAYSLFAWGLSKLDATDVSMFAYIDPVFGTIFAYYLLSEPITLPFILGSILIFGGIWIAEGRIHHYPIRKLFTIDPKT